jgi:muconolactone delta-isomerase
MDFLVEFEVDVPAGTSDTEVKDRERAEAVAATKLADEGHLLRVWKRPLSAGEASVLGLYRADSETELDRLLGALPLYEWMTVTVSRLEPHPNDPTPHARDGDAQPLGARDDRRPAQAAAEPCLPIGGTARRTARSG